MSKKSFAVAVKKGGTGKTTLSLNLAVFFAALGLKVGLFDLDPQGHISVSLDVLDDDGLPHEGVFDFLINRRPFAECVYYAPDDEWAGIKQRDGGSILVMPGGNRTQLAAVGVAQNGADYDMLTEAMQEMRQHCDVVISDTAPSNSLFQAGIYAANDYVLVPTHLSILSIQSVDATIREMAKLNRLHNAEIMGIVPTMTQANTNEDERQLGVLRDSYGEHLVWHDTAVPYSAVWRTASEEARTIFSFQSKTNPNGKAKAQAAMAALAHQVLSKLEVTTHDFPTTAA